jgi:hypothetical protein
MGTLLLYRDRRVSRECELPLGGSLFLNGFGCYLRYRRGHNPISIFRYGCHRRLPAGFQVSAVAGCRSLCRRVERMIGVRDVSRPAGPALKRPRRFGVLVSSSAVGVALIFCGIALTWTAWTTPTATHLADCHTTAASDGGSGEGRIRCVEVSGRTTVGTLDIPAVTNENLDGMVLCPCTPGSTDRPPKWFGPALIASGFFQFLLRSRLRGWRVRWRG